jgi:hypothetical protein
MKGCEHDSPQTHHVPVRRGGGSGITASKLGTTARSDGKPQVTYNGHPLYTFANDQKAGDTSGQGLNAFGGPWYVLSPAGTAITSRERDRVAVRPAARCMVCKALPRKRVETPTRRAVWFQADISAAR